MKILLDTNVALDLFLGRPPWNKEAEQIWQAHLDNVVQAHVAASAVTDIFYILSRELGLEVAQEAVDRLLRAVDIVAVDHGVLNYAHHLPGKDFEDNVQIACAARAKVGAIVTRNKTDFRLATVPVFTPAEFVAELNL